MKIEEQFKLLKSNYDINRLTSIKYKFIVFQLLSTITSLGVVQLFTLLEKGKEFRNCWLKTIIMKMDCINKYKKCDLIVASKDVFTTYKLANAFEMFKTKSASVQQEFIKELRYFENND